MTPISANNLLDAETVLVGTIQRGAGRPTALTRSSGEEVRLNTKLDAASRFCFQVSHPGAATPIEAELLIAPIRQDGSTGTYVSVCKVAVPAEGGRVEALVNGSAIAIVAADRRRSPMPCLAMAKAVITPAAPDGLLAGLTATVAA